MEHLYKFKEDNEYYTFSKDVQYFIDNVYIDKSKTIWLPFDTKESAFYKVLTKNGYKVIQSHIEEGKDFFEYEPKEHYDLILSNPPFKGKANIIRRLIELNKPFGLIFGIQCFNSGGFTRLLNELNNLEIIFLARRIKFHKGNENEKVSQPTFHSIWLCNDIMGKKLTILEGAK